MTTQPQNDNRIDSFKLGLITLACLIFIAVTFVPIYNIAKKSSTDLLPTWLAAKMFWEDGVNPYDDIIGQESQLMIYGELVGPEQDQFQYVYPFYGILYIGPLAFADFPLAAAVYMEVLLIGMILTLGLMLDALKTLPKPVTLGVMMLWTLIAYFTVRGLLLGQPEFVAYIAHIVALWGILKGHDKTAGVALAVSTVKPQTGFLIVPLLLIWAWRMKRHNIISAFVAMFGLLCGLSFILQPTWLFDWIERMQSYAGYAETFPAAHILTHFLNMDSPIEDLAYVLLSLALLLPVLYLWKKNDPFQFLWLYFMTMTVGLMISPRVATTYYIEMYPVLYVTALIWERCRRSLRIVGYGLALLLGYWLLHLATVPSVEEGGGGLEAPIVYVVFPVLVMALLLWYRTAWSDFATQKQLLVGE